MFNIDDIMLIEIRMDVAVNKSIVIHMFLNKRFRISIMRIEDTDL